MRTSRLQIPRARRRGVVLLTVIVLTMALSMLLAVWVQGAVRRQRELKLRAWELQSTWLAEAGIERGVARLAANDAYTGETWQIPSGDAERYVGAVQIKVEEVPGIPELRVLTATADYPNDDLYRARTTKRVPLNMNLVRGDPR